MRDHLSLTTIFLFSLINLSHPPLSSDHFRLVLKVIPKDRVPVYDQRLSHSQDVGKHTDSPHICGKGNGLDVKGFRRGKARRAMVQETLLRRRHFPGQAKVDQLGRFQAVSGQKQVGGLL